MAARTVTRVSLGELTEYKLFMVKVLDAGLKDPEKQRAAMRVTVC